MHANHTPLLGNAGPQRFPHQAASGPLSCHFPTTGTNIKVCHALHGTKSLQLFAMPATSSTIAPAANCIMLRQHSSISAGHGHQDTCSYTDARFCMGALVTPAGVSRRNVNSWHQPYGDACKHLSVSLAIKLQWCFDRGDRQACNVMPVDAPAVVESAYSVSSDTRLLRVSGSTNQRCFRRCQHSIRVRPTAHDYTPKTGMMH